MTTNRLLESAMFYAERLSWPIFPLRPGDKRPAVKDWPNVATTDPATIRQWWARWPGANIGLACGDLLAVDLDVKGQVNGIESWAALGIESNTATSNTPTGGRHLLYSANGAELGNTAGKLGPGIDTRGRGGYIVLPPSSLTDGTAYTWQTKPTDTPPAALPLALVAMLTDPPKPETSTPIPSTPAAQAEPYARAALQGELERVSLATEGQRNTTLNQAAYNLGQLVGAGALSRADVEAELERAGLGIGLSQRETLVTIASGLDAGERDPRIIPGPTVPSSPPPEAGKAETSEAELNRFLLTADADDEGNAQCVHSLAGRAFSFCEAYGWMHWDGSHWERENAEAELDRQIIDMLKQRRILAVEAEREALVKATRPSAHRVRGIKYLLGSIVISSVAEYDRSPDHLNAKNGVIDLRTGELVAHESSQRFTYCLPVEYDPATDVSGWEDWLLEAVGGNAVIVTYLQEAVGYSLTGHTSEEVLFYIYGPARAGKGTFTEAILSMMGKPLATEADFETFTRDRRGDVNSPDLANLKPSRFVAASESERERWLNAAKVKVLTGGNYITCALKYRDHFTYRPQFKVWLSSNHPVMIDVDDDAAWARIRVIHFPTSHLEDEDKTLKARMKRPAMARQILAWAVEGARRWYASGKTGLITPATVSDKTRAARDDLDFVGQWLAECIERTDEPGAFVSNPTLYASYSEWCKESGIMPKGQTKLTQALRSKGYEAGVRARIGGKQTRGAQGVKLVELPI